jgi:hypothetical protein
MAVFKIDPVPVEDRKKKIERDDDSKKSHRALARCGGDETAIAPSPGRHAGHPLERAIERRLGIVTDIGCDRGKAAATVPDPFGSELHAPAGDVLDRGLAQYRVKPLGEHGT